jgi:hypothetical protein
VKHKQLSFHFLPSFRDFIPRIEHGSNIRKGKRKLARPFSINKAIHLILRSTKARGAWSFLKSKNEKIIYKLIYHYAAKFNVKIYRYANAGNHLHILLKAGSKKDFQNFLRTITGIIPRLVTGAQKRKAKGKFWDELVYTKLVAWGRQFKNTSNYVFKNALEAFGIIPPRHEARGHVTLDYLDLYDG